ncbi:MAG: DUF6476 family protein [Paracoccaceae bacterium]
MSDIMPPAGPEGGDLPPDLKFLKRLVTALTATMIVGLITIIALFVIRLPVPAQQEVALPPALPDGITLPDGAGALAVTIGSDWYGVVTDQNEFLIFDKASGVLRQRVAINPPAE